MTDQNNKSSSFRFRLSSLIAAITFAAITIVAGRYLYDWYTTTPLSASVARFNSAASNNPVGKHEAPITEDEIVQAINSQLPTLDAADPIKAIYSRIASSRRLPHGAVLDSITRYSTSPGKHYTVWWINLEIRTGTTGYALRIRETDNPVAAVGEPLEQTKP